MFADVDQKQLDSLLDTIFTKVCIKDSQQLETFAVKMDENRTDPDAPTEKDKMSDLSLDVASVEIDSSTKTQRVSVFLSKLPVYILYLFNWIPWKPDSKLLLAFTLMLHITGLVVSLIFFTGVISHVGQSNSIYMILKVPKVIQYCSISPVGCLIAVSFVFLYSQWKYFPSSTVLQKITKLNTPGEWSSKHTVVILILVCHGILSSICLYFLVGDMFLREDNMSVLLYFFKNETTRQALRNFEMFYAVYMSICFYMFPSLLGYICISLKMVCHKSTKHLAVKDFKKFAENFQSFIELVSETDKLFSMTLGVYIVALVNDVIVWIYFSLVFDKCGVARMMYPQIACDSLAVGFVFVLAAAVHSEVSSVSSKNRKCICVVWKSCLFPRARSSFRARC